MRWTIIATLALAFLAGCGNQEESAAQNDPAPETAKPEGVKADEGGAGLRLNPNYKGN